MSWEHKMPTWMMFGVAIIVVLAAISYFGREGYVPEFLDQSNVERTQDLAVSSYAQVTNSVRPDGRFDAPPIQGIKSPFRVNMVDAYIP